MSLMDFAKHELEIIENTCSSEDSLKIQKMISKEVLEVLQVLCDQGHSNNTASYIMNIIRKLWAYKPLTKLTGEKDEWNYVGDNCYQNKRCSAVFKEGIDGKAYYLDGYAYCDPNDDVWFFHSRESRKYIDFPCDSKTLETEYRKLLFSSEYIPIKWAKRFHLYRKVK